MVSENFPQLNLAYICSGCLHNRKDHFDTEVSAEGWLRWAKHAQQHHWCQCHLQPSANDHDVESH
jgi:hypothetical protein